MKTVLFIQSANSQSNQAPLAGTIRAAKTFGWQIRVIEFGQVSADRIHHDSGMRELLKDFRRMNEFWSPAGIIADCGGAPTRFRKDQFGLPTVFLDRYPSTIEKGAACVWLDATALGELAARELLTLNAAIYAYVPFPGDPEWSINRGLAFEKAIGMNHAAFERFSPRNPRRLYIRELDRWIGKLPKPAAIFAANDYISEMVATSAVKHGFKIPGEIAILGVDNDEQVCLRTTPSLSSIKPDHEKAGYLAATLLKDLIAGTRSTPRAQTFGPLAVFHRGSTRALQRKDNRIARILESIRENATSGITVAQLVKGLKVSRRLIEMRFRETTGKSIHEEIQAVRLERAKVMLTQSRLPMDEVARSSGFSSAQALRKALLKATGKTPVAWRKQHLR